LRSDDVVFGYQGAYGLFPSQNSALPQANVVLRSLNDGSGRFSQPAVVGARMFNTAYDVAVTLYEDQQNQLLQWRLDNSTGTLASGTFVLPAASSGSSGRLAVLAGDFTGDGFDEIVVFPKGTESPNAIVATAQDVQHPSSGLRFGPSFPLFGHVLPFNIAKATVLGTPRLLVAGPAGSNSGCSSGFTGLQLESYTIDPQSLALTSIGTFAPNIPEGQSACLHGVDVAAGRFNTTQHDQLLVGYGMQGGNVKVVPFDFNTQGSAVQELLFDTGLPVDGGGFFVRTGRFDWSSTTDQAALFISNAFNAPGINTLRILTLDQTFTTHAGPSFQAGAVANECANDMAVGNFDHQQANPGTPPPATIVNPNLQVAIPFTDCQNTIALRIFDVAPDTFQISQTSNLNFSPAVSGTGGSVFQSTLAVADLQGRSLRVGPPGIITVNKRQQATLILAAPPMHVDAIVPVDGRPGAVPKPFNVTAVPDGLNGGYTFSSSTSQTKSTTTGFTTSFSATESLNTTATFGDCDVGDCASVSNKFTANQAAETSQSSVNGSYSGSSLTFNVTTGFSDLLSYENETLVIYAYPAIGRTVCPSDNPTCTNPGPLTINVAGPDTVSYNDAIPGNVLPWYQPPWIPGNILSYPGNAQQLQAAVFRDPSDFQELSQPLSWFIGSGGTASASVTWTGGSSGGNTTSTTHNFSFEDDISASGSIGLSDVVTLSGDVSVDLGGSVGFSTLTDSLTTLSATQGISFTRTAPLDDNNYGYTVTPHIFSRTQPPSVISDTIPTPASQVQAFGALRTGYEVDLSASSGGGGFWSAWYGKAPDVALNHPERWSVKLKVTDPGNGSCRPFNATSSDVDCVVLGPRLPAGLGSQIWLSSFHRMRGFFVTGPNGGPQLTTATTGDQLLLQARVYNLSLAPFPAGAIVHVRFMGMPWNTSASNPAGRSFEIGEQTITGDQLPPPFSSDASDPNWVLVPQTFATGGTSCGGQSCNNQDLVFWVAVWIENANGTLAAELSEHGLKSIPAPGEDFLISAGREQPFSNNLGFYNQVFHIFPQSPTLQAPTPAQGEIGAQLVQVGAAHRTLDLGESTALAAQVRTGGRDLKGGLEVVFYDGDPLGGGTLIGLQSLPHLKAQTMYDFRVPFTPQQCGQRTVYVVAGADTRHEHTARLQPIDVKGADCEPPGPPLQIALAGSAEKVGSGGPNGKVSLHGKQPLGGALDLSTASLTLQNVLTEGNGAGELLHAGNGASSLPQRLTARVGSTATQARFESAPAAQPKFRVEVKNRDPKKGIVEVTLKAEDGVIAPSRRCAASSQRTSMTTRLTLDDGVHPAQVLVWTQPWQCEGDRLTTR